MQDEGKFFRCLARCRWLLATALAAALVVLCLPVPSGYAQVTTATILGNVLDQSGAAVPGAAITVTNTGTGAVVKTTSGPDGSYLVHDLSITGAYTVDVSAAGFRTFEQKDIVLAINQNARVDARLEVGATTQTIEVTGQPPQVDTASSSLGEVVTSRSIEELPLNGRNPTQLVTLAAGVTTATTPEVVAWRGGSYWSSNGTRGDENAILLNGALYEGAYFNNGLNLPSPDALQEFKLITNTYPAEYGRNAGSVLNAVVKSGTNRFHGDAWEFWRNNDLNARNWFTPSVPTLNQNQFGFTAGGPIIKNKFFIFGAYQGLRIAQKTQNNGYMPTPTELAGYYTEPAGVSLINPATSTAFPTATTGCLYAANLACPANTFYINPTSYNPVANLVVSKYLTGVAGTDPVTGFVTTNGSAPTTNNQFLIKGDYNITSTNKLNFTWMRDRTASTNPFFGGTVSTYDTEKPTTHIAIYTLNDTETLRPNLLNELRASYTRLLDTLECQPQFYANALGINYTPDAGPPQNPDFDVSGFFSLNSVGLCNLWEGTPTREINDTVSWIKGNHELKFGGQWFDNTNTIYAAYLAEGNFNFNGSYTNNSLADFMLGDVSLYQRQTAGTGLLISNEAAAFAQDNWKVNRKLTVNLGLRWYFQQPWYATAGGVDFDPKTSSGQWDPGYQGTKYIGEPPDVLMNYSNDVGPIGKIPRGLYNPQKDMLEPRVGFAIDPKGDGRTSIRVSYGIFHDIVVTDAIAQAGSIQPGVYREKFTDPVGGLSNPYLDEANPWPYTGYLQAQPKFFLPGTAAALDGHTKNAFIQGWTLDIQHQLKDNLMVEIAYVGKNTTHMIVDMDGNSPYNYSNPAGLSSLPSVLGDWTAPGANEDLRRPYYLINGTPTWETISNVGSWGKGRYEALELSGEYRLKRGLTFQMAYTYSHGLDTNSNYNVAASNQIQDSYCLQCEFGNSDNDRRHVFVASWVYNLPTPFSGLNSGGAKAGRAVLGNWEVSGIVRILSGGPFTCHEGADASRSGDGNDRCTFAGGNNWQISGSRSHAQEVAEWFNTSAFAATPAGYYGDSGRNQLIGPGYRNADIAILRNFPISERFGSLQFRAEFYNAFNLVTFGGPNATFTSGGFGQIGSAGSPRLIQLGMKYAW